MFLGRTLVHGIYALCYLSRRPAGELASAHAVADAVGVPSEHARKILSALAAGGLIDSVRGRAGGYALARSLQDITVLDVRDAVQPDAAAAVADMSRTCPVASNRACCVGPGIAALRDDIRELLAQRTLDQVIGEECRGTAPRTEPSAQHALTGA